MENHSFNLIIEAILFDFDGTLIDASDVICSSFNRSLSGQGIPTLSPDRIKPMIGKPLREMFSSFAVQADLNDLIDGYRLAFNELSPGRSRLLPGVDELINGLDPEVKLGVVTSRSGKGARRILNDFGLLKRFEVVVGIEDVVNGKPEPEGVLSALDQIGVSPQKAVFVGDTVFDIEAGKRAGTFTVGIGTGYHSKSDLIRAGADRVFDTISEVISFVS
jgi:HAD superfamily hydrolase (TIGR01509 family)